MRTPEETAAAILSGTPALELCDEIVPLAQAYLESRCRETAAHSERITALERERAGYRTALEQICNSLFDARIGEAGLIAHAALSGATPRTNIVEVLREQTEYAKTHVPEAPMVPVPIPGGEKSK